MECECPNECHAAYKVPAHCEKCETKCDAVGSEFCYQFEKPKEEEPKPPRYLPDVIDAVMALLPAGSDLWGTLEDIKGSAMSAPPEGMGLWWSRFCGAVEKALPYPPETDWQREVFRVVTQKEPPSAL
jgi:hypothetical protein